MKKIKWKRIYKYYLNHRISLKSLASKFGVKYGTIKARKFRHHWKSNRVSAKSMAEQLDQSNLNGKNKLFCALWLKDYNATKDYRKVYHCKLSTAQVNGSRLLRRPKIQKQLTKLRREQVANLHIDKSDVLRQLISEFFADPSDWLKFGHRTCVDPETHERYQRSYLYFRNQPLNDDQLLNGVKLGRDSGATVQLPDKARLAGLLLDYLPNPANHNYHKDTLIMALMKSVKNSGDGDE